MSTPRINPNDPKWTAYVLGELDEGERAAVERLLGSSDEARTLVEDLKTASQALEGALASDVPPLLHPAQRAAVHTAAEARGAGPARGTRLQRLFAPWPTQRALGLGAAAAVLIVAAVLRVPPE